jgi:hypothetical protein
MKDEKSKKKFFTKKENLRFFSSFIVVILFLSTELITTLKLENKDLLILDGISCILVIAFIFLSGERRQKQIENTSTSTLKRDIIRVLVFLVFIFSIKKLIILII